MAAAAAGQQLLQRVAARRNAGSAQTNRNADLRLQQKQTAEILLRRRVYLGAGTSLPLILTLSKTKPFVFLKSVGVLA
jgi:hypothetical protein